MTAEMRAELTQPITQRCLAVVSGIRCGGKPGIGECLCPVHVEQRELDKREYEVAIVDLAEFSDEWCRIANP